MLSVVLRRVQILLFASVISVYPLVNILDAESVNLNTVVVNVNGEVITLAHLIAEVTTLSPEYLQLSDEYLFENVLDQLISRILLASLSEDETLGTKSLIENNKRSIRASQSIKNFLANVPSYDQLMKLYEEKMSSYSPDKEYSASHILLNTKDEADNMLERLNEGENFASLAAQFSIGPSAPKGGNIGWFVMGQMVPEFEVAVLSLELGMVSRPIQTEFGWHIIKLDGERLQPQPSLQELRQQLEMELKEDYLNNKIEELRSIAEITHFETGVDKAIIKDSGLLFNK